MRAATKPTERTAESATNIAAQRFGCGQQLGKQSGKRAYAVASVSR
jgi:hypothetical protein